MTITAGSLVFSNGSGALAFKTTSGAAITAPPGVPSGKGQLGIGSMATGILATINQSIASGPGIVAGITAVQTANPGSAPSGFTATATTGGNVAPNGTLRIYYKLASIDSGTNVETPVATTFVDIDNTNNAVNLSWTLVPGNKLRLYSSLRSDFLQFAMLYLEPTFVWSLNAGTTTYTDAYPGTSVNGVPPVGGTQWTFVSRLNVTYYVFAKLTSTTYTLVASAATFSICPLVIGGQYASPGQRFATISWTNFVGNIGYRVIRYVTEYSDWNPAFNRQWDLTTGTVTLNDDFSDTTATDAATMINVKTFTLYDWQFSLIASATPVAATSVAIVPSYTYFICNNAGNIQISKRDTSAIEVNAWTLGATGSFGAGNDPVALAVAQDETKAYYGGADENIVHAWDLGAGTSLGTFATGAASQGVAVNSMIATSAGIFIGWGLADGSAGSIKQYNSAGTLIATFTCSKRPMVLSPGLDATSIWAVLFDGTVINFKVSDQSTLHSFAYGSVNPMAVLRVGITTPGAVNMSSPRYWVALRRVTT